jgi:hypothetical protein
MLHSNTLVRHVSVGEPVRSEPIVVAADAEPGTTASTAATTVAPLSISRTLQGVF